MVLYFCVDFLETLQVILRLFGSFQSWWFTVLHKSYEVAIWNRVGIASNYDWFGRLGSFIHDFQQLGELVVFDSLEAWVPKEMGGGNIECSSGLPLLQLHIETELTCMRIALFPFASSG